MFLGCGCLLAMALAFAPRIVLILAWIFSDRWARVWQGNWILPLLGIIALPYTTAMYMLVWGPAGIVGWDWMWIGMGVLLDLMKWGQMIRMRRETPGYPASAP
jgi:galactitol-specific phosphotransferase system IIC component